MTVDQFLETILKLSMVTFVVSLMLSLGLSLTMAQIVAPLRNPVRVALALLANFVLVPILAVGISKVLGLDQAFQTGMIILGLGAGAPFLPKLTQLAKGDVAYAVGLMVLLMVLTVFYLPIVLPFALPGVSVDAVSIAESLIVLMLIPLSAGLLAKATWPDDTQEWQALFSKVATIFMPIVLVIGVGLDVPNILSLIGTSGLAAIVALIVGSMVIGFLLGGRDPAERSVLVVGTGFRNASAAFVVAAANFSGTPTLKFILVSLPIFMLLTVLGALALGRRATGSAGPIAGAGSDGVAPLGSPASPSV